MKKYIIVEDNHKASLTLQAMLEEHCPDLSLLDTASTVKEAILLLQTNAPDLLFLDINLGNETAFSILEKVDTQAKIIFTTAFDKYAIKAFKFSAVDYLLKPIKAEELVDAIERAFNENDAYIKEKITSLNHNFSMPSKKIVLNNSDGIYFCDLNEIIKVEAFGNYTKFYLKNNPSPLLVTKTLKEFEKMSKDYGFIRTHHSHIINTAFVRKYVNKDGGYLIMKDKTSVPISQRKKNDILHFIASLT